MVTIAVVIFAVAYLIRDWFSRRFERRIDILFRCLARVGEQTSLDLLVRLGFRPYRHLVEMERRGLVVSREEAGGPERGGRARRRYRLATADEARASRRCVTPRVRNI